VLFRSSDDYVTAMLLGTTVMSLMGGLALIFPLLLGAVGIIATIVGVFVTTALSGKPMRSFNLGLGTSSLLSIIGAYIVCTMVLGDIRASERVALLLLGNHSNSHG